MISKEKQKIRQRLKSLRLGLAAVERDDKNQTIEKQFFITEEFKKAKVISIYISDSEEVETKNIIKKVLQMGKKVAVPSLKNGQPCMRFLQGVERLEDHIPFLTSNAPEAKPDNLDLIVLPGIGFDKKGARIGRGKGYYDKFLKEIKGKIPLIALAYDFQVLDEIPEEPHDVSLDKIITEKRVIKPVLPSLVLMTGNGLRHRYFANQLINKLDVKGIVVEAKKPIPQAEAKQENLIIQQHFQQRDKTEARYFAGNDSFELPTKQVLSVPNGESNSPQVFEWVKNLKPDFVILYGTSIIKDPLLSYFDNRMINIHLGLSPYYRGSGTNFWPLVNREPECVGATIHLAILKVDAGPILGQVRAEPELSDGCHDLGCKAIIEGGELMAKCISLYHRGSIKPRSQSLGGQLYRRKDFTAEAVKKMRYNFEEGMIKEYLNSKEKIIKEKPIVEI